jgi:hypothetical protein
MGACIIIFFLFLFLSLSPHLVGARGVAGGAVAAPSNAPVPKAGSLERPGVRGEDAADEEEGSLMSFFFFFSFEKKSENQSHFFFQFQLISISFPTLAAQLPPPPQPRVTGQRSETSTSFLARTKEKPKQE